MTVDRPALPRAAYKALCARDGERCHDCGARAVKLDIDHDIPWWRVKRLMGRNRAWYASVANLRLRCIACHGRKTIREAAERAHQKRLEAKRRPVRKPLVGDDGQRLT